MDEMMMTTRSPQKQRNQSITTTTFPSWKLYENPLFYSQQQRRHHQQYQHYNHHPHCFHLPLSAHSIVASLWDPSFFRPIMDSDLVIVRAQIAELKSELESERKVRKKVESINKRLTKELSEERKGREAIERVCEELAKEIASNRAAIDRIEREMEEERKMLRMAEVLREERVQMKLSEARILFEEKLLEFSKGVQVETSTTGVEQKNEEEEALANVTTNESTTMISYGNSISAEFRSTTNQRRASPEAENPHIKRGIKGFVEFPRVVRAIGSRGRHLGSKLECQKAQLRLLLRHKSPSRTDSLIMG